MLSLVKITPLKALKKDNLQNIYGPVPSRRLGYSLGIDLVPFKTCSYNCIYCQLGRTTCQTAERKKYLPVQKILKDLKKILKQNIHIDFVTLSGSGEPTLNSEIGMLIKAIKKITDIPVAVITNSSLIYKKDLQQALLNADVVLPTFTTANPVTFKMIHRPITPITLERVVKGLVNFRKIYKGQIWLEIMLIKKFNDTKQELKLLKKIINKIKPDRIQLNTVVRPPSEKYAEPLSLSQLNKIKTIFGKNCEAVAEFKKPSNLIKSTNCEKNILAYLKRRPGTLNDLQKGLSININELIKNLDRLLITKKIKKRIHEGKIFYESH